MGWDIELVDSEGKIVEVPRHWEGSTIAISGIEYADLNLTYNYSKWYYEFLDSKEGLRWLNNKKAKDTIKTMEKAIEKLGTERDNDYWAPTPGNAGYALSILIHWAKQHPEATWKIA